MIFCGRGWQEMGTKLEKKLKKLFGGNKKLRAVQVLIDQELSSFESFFTESF